MQAKIKSTWYIIVKNFYSLVYYDLIIFIGNYTKQ